MITDHLILGWNSFCIGGLIIIYYLWSRHTIKLNMLCSQMYSLAWNTFVSKFIMGYVHETGFKLSIAYYLCNIINFSSIDDMVVIRHGVKLILECNIIQRRITTDILVMYRGYCIISNTCSKT